MGARSGEALVEAVKLGGEGGGAAPAEQGVAVDIQVCGDGGGAVAGEEQAQGGELDGVVGWEDES